MLLNIYMISIKYFPVEQTVYFPQSILISGLDARGTISIITNRLVHLAGGTFSPVRAQPPSWAAVTHAAA